MDRLLSLRGALKKKWYASFQSSWIDAGDVVFSALLVFNVVRALRHAMWRDELQIYQLAANSASLFELWEKLRYEAHGILWDGLVWGVAHLTTDPSWMQVLHALIAAGIWLVVYRLAPFTRIEKIILLLSYFLFFEYFVIARSYSLAVLCGLGFVALRQQRPASLVLPWFLLGMMANLVMHATIWSFALAAGFVVEHRGRLQDVRFLLGGMLYLSLLAFGIFTMIPASDYIVANSHPALPGLGDLNIALGTMVGAFLPLDPEWPHAARAFLTERGPVPFFWNPQLLDPILTVTGADGLHPMRIAAFLGLPIGLCILLARHRAFEFVIAYIGIMLFAVVWHYPGSARHDGFVFVAFVAAVWAARARIQPSWLFIAVLGINALGGIMTIGSEFNVFSQARNAAQWIESSKLSLPLIGQRDAQVSSVAGYLGRPIYYLECECYGTFIVWNRQRQPPLSDEEFRTRLARAIDREGGDVVLIRNHPLSTDQAPATADTTLLASFTGVRDVRVDENYWIYRITRLRPAG